MQNAHIFPSLIAGIYKYVRLTGFVVVMLIALLAILYTGTTDVHAATHRHLAQTTASTTSASTSTNYPNSYVDYARQAAINAGISPDLFVNQIQQESGFNPNAVSYAGAIGIAQFMPATAASMGVNPYDPYSSLSGAARLMANLNAQFGGDYAKALAAYNAGPGAVYAAINMGGSNWLAYMPAETQNYVHIIYG